MNAPTRSSRNHLVQLAVAGVLALAVFYILNPVWWGDPITRAGEVLEDREDLLELQVTVFGGYDDFGDSLAGLGRQVFIGTPQYYEAPAFADYIPDQIARYEASLWRGITIGGSVAGAVVLGALTLLGLWRLVRANDIHASTRWLVGMWALAMFATTAVLTPLEWQRYYLQVILAVILLAALGVGWIISRVQQHIAEG